MNSRKLITDQELWSDFTQGNTDSLGQLVEKYYQPLAANLFRYVKKETEVEDLISEVFVWVLENQDRLAQSQVRNLSAFLTEIGKKIYFSNRRNATRRQELLEAKVMPLIPRMAKPSGPEVAYAQDVLATVERIKNPLRRKILFLLIEGFDACEIAKELGKSSKWVHQNVYLARRELRGILAG